MKQWKKPLGTLMFLSVLIITLSLHGTAFSQETTRVFVSPAEIVATTCGTQTVEVRVENVVDLTGYHLEISFDPNVMEVTDVVNGGFLAPPGESALYEPTNEIDNVHGLITFGLVQQGDGTGDPLPKSGDGVLLEITFQAVVPNETSDITIDAVNSILVDWPDVSPIDFTTSDGLVTTESCSPTGMDIIDNWIPENEPVGTEVGIFYTIDPDVPNDTFTYELVPGVGDDDNDSFEIDGSSLKTKEVFNYEEQMIHRIRVRSTDWGGKTFEKAFLIFVLDVNDPPVAVDDEYETDEDTTLTIAAPGVLDNDIDVDLNIMTASLVTDVEHGTLTLKGDGSFVYVPDPNFFGTDTFVYQLVTYPATQSLWTDEATVTITVTEVKDQVEAVDDFYTTDANTTLTVEAPGVLANDIDVDNNIRAASLVTNVQHGDLSLLSDGSFTYVPDPGFFGTDTFVYQLVTTLAPQSLWTDEATVTITVQPLTSLFLPIILR